MFHFFRHRYDKYKPSKYILNPVRCVELVLCITCLLMSLTIIMALPSLSVVTKVVITFTASAYSVITIVDVVSHCHKNPMFWNIWILFAVSGSLQFFLCVGILIGTTKKTTSLLFIAEMINALTATVFLLDAITILFLLRREKFEILPEETPEPPKKHIPPCVWAYLQGYKQPEQVYQQPKEVYEEPKQVYQQPEEVYEQPEQVPVVIPRNAIPVCECDEPLPPTKSRSSTSYGGTFPVSKDATPLPSPEPKKHRPLKKKSGVRLSESQTLTTPTTGRLQRGADGRMYLADGTPLNEVILCNGDIEYRDASGVSYTRDGIPIAPDKKPSIEIFRPKENTQGTELLQSSNEDSAPVNLKEADSCKLYSSDGTPLTEIILHSGEIMYKGPHGELYNTDGTPVQHQEKKKSSTSVSKKKRTDEASHQMVCRRSSPQHIDSEQSITSVSSRTVAVSTRMVPKNKDQKKESAPASSHTQMATSRDNKSADTEHPTHASYQYQQQPQVLYHQVMQRPCGCGKMHLETTSTVQGVVSQTSPQSGSKDAAEKSQTTPHFYSQDATAKASPSPYTMQIVRPPGSPPCMKSSCAQPTAFSPTIPLSPHQSSSRAQHSPPVQTSPHTQRQPSAHPMSSTHQSSCGHPQPSSDSQSFSQQQQSCHPQSFSQMQKVSQSPPSSQLPKGQQLLPVIQESPPSSQSHIAKECGCKGTLQTISECDCESEPASTCCDDRESPTEKSSLRHTSSEHAESCTNTKCMDRNCRTHSSMRSVGSDAVQTSETRMIRASDVQKINLNQDQTSRGGK